MTTGTEGYTLTIGDLSQVVPMAFPDATVAQQLAARLKSGDDQALSVRITPAEESDVEGHLRSSAVSITIQLDDDDVEGHAMSVHFPSIAEADRFRRRLMAVGLLAGTIAIGSAGAAVIANQPISTGAAVPGSAPITYQAPAGRGFFEGADISVAPAAAGAAAEAAVGSGTRGGMVEGADIGMPAAAGAAAAGAAANAANAQTRGGLVEGADVNAGEFGIGSSVERSQVANADTRGGLVEGADVDAGEFGIGSSVERSRVSGPVEGADL
jgi:hypothetical protein